MEQPLSLRSFPRAIIHVDGDSFFASCEQALHIELRGKPLITGKERGVATAVSKEAKKLGITRGMSTREIRQICPDIIYRPSDYESYSLFSKRMTAIVRRHTTLVEEYSIDECFADITGLRRPLRLSYPAIAAQIKSDLERELGMTFSVGLGPTKVVAKLGSKWNKPSGLVVIPGTELHTFLGKTPVERIWGIGEQTTAYMHGLGITTALDFARRNEAWVMKTFTKPHHDIWNELRGNSVLALNAKEKHDYASISKAKTFNPPSGVRSVVLSHLSKNVENACIKARRHNLAARKIFFLLQTRDHRHSSYEISLSHPTNIPGEIVSVIDAHFDRIFRGNTLYRQTMVVLMHLSPDTLRQADLFGTDIGTENARLVYDAIDDLAKKFGKHTVFLGTSSAAMTKKCATLSDATLSTRKGDLFKGETTRQRIGIPMLGSVG